MIEAALIFALGALVATLIALLMLRPVWNRAVRLTTRRVQASLPLSLDEIKVDRDQLRADMAVQTARAEAEGSRQRAKANTLAVELAARHEAAIDLANTLTEREASISNLEGEIARQKATIETLSAALADEQKQHGETRDILADSQHDVARLTAEMEVRTRELAAHGNDIIALKATGDSLTTELRETAAELAHMRERLGIVQGEFDEAATALSRDRIAMGELRQTHQALGERHAEKTAALDQAGKQIFALQDSLGEQRTALSAAQTRIHMLEMEAESRQRSIAPLQAAAQAHAEQVERLKNDLDAKTRTLFAAKTALEKMKLEQNTLVAALKDARAAHGTVMADLENTRASLADEAQRRAATEATHAHAEQAHASEKKANLSDRERFEATIHALSQELELMRAEKNRLNGMLAARNQRLSGHMPAAEIDRSHLREQIEQIAAELAHITRRIEGDASPINALLATARQPNNRPSSRKTLADRIKALEKPLS